jgi:hypothetical protein
MNIEFLSTLAVIAPDPPQSRKLYIDVLGCRSMAPPATTSTASSDSGQRNEGQVAADQAFLDRAEHRLVGFDIDVDVLEFADLFSVAVD